MSIGWVRSFVREDKTVGEIMIAGSGPVGSLLALTLARRGLDVSLYERRADPRQGAHAAGRSINLAVSTRGLHALHQVGLDEEVLHSAVPMRGRLIHAPDGKQSFQPYGNKPSDFINSMSRGGLNMLLLEKAEQAGARVHFEHKLSSYDYAKRAAVYDKGTVPAQVLIGSDGAGSALRACIPNAVTSNESLSSGYKELTMPPVRAAHAMEREALHIWPRGSFMLIALPNLDGSFTCTLFLDLKAFEELTAAAAAEAFFAKHFADALQLIPDLPAQFVAAPLGRMQTIKTWPWSHAGTLLLGDAAHAIVPFFGQGMNSGFEDVTLLAEELARTPDFAEAFERFAAARKPDTEAIADLAVENFVEMRDKVADPRFLELRALEHDLQDKMPGRYLTRYQLVTFTRIPYRVALEAGRIQSRILHELLPAPDLDRGVRLAKERLLPLLQAHGL
jgi:kynurenine 3-monooxygenase